MSVTAYVTMIQVIIKEKNLNSFIHGLCSFLFKTSVCLSISSVNCIAEVAKVERTQHFEHIPIFKALVNQVVLSLMGVFVEFFWGFVSSGAKLLLTLVSIKTI